MSVDLAFAIVECPPRFRLQPSYRNSFNTQELETGRKCRHHLDSIALFYAIFLWSLLDINLLSLSSRRVSTSPRGPVFVHDYTAPTSNGLAQAPSSFNILPKECFIHIQGWKLLLTQAFDDNSHPPMAQVPAL